MSGTLYILMKNDSPIAASYCEEWLEDVAKCLTDSQEGKYFHIESTAPVCDSKSKVEALAGNGFRWVDVGLER